LVFETYNGKQINPGFVGRIAYLKQYMHCINCGSKLGEDEKFCTNCGKKVVKLDELIQTPQKKSWHWKTIILTVLLTSFFWFFYYFGFVDKSDESANIMGHLIETVGRQKQAWGKSEQITELIGTGISEECLYTEGCVDEVVGQITILRAEIDKESSEIDNLWSENIIGRDFDMYFSSLTESDQIKLIDIMNIYFPEESKELETTNKLL